LLLSVAVLVGLQTSPALAASSHAEIDGSGSSWAANAVNQWVTDVTSQGLRVGFTSLGSAQGRQDFSNSLTDFGVSDIAYQGTDPISGQKDQSIRPYAYLPIVAGGTSFPYHLGDGTNRITNLRLSGQTIAKIFTNQITNWNDPQIKADNNNLITLPNLRITPVVHSEGTGSTAQFTAYLAKQFPTIWTPYSGVDSMTEYYPVKGNQKAQNGSDGIMNFITSAAGNGSIGFDEYSYALLAKFPVVKVLNAAGFYTLPNQYNVAVALQKAVINDDPTSPDYLTQKLDQVYVNPAPQAYPLSSYSYMIIPTGVSGSGKTQEQRASTTAKRQTIAEFLNYSICNGQAEVGPIGYSALPLNLVQAGFGQIAKLKAADPNVVLSADPVSKCTNPTFDKADPSKNLLAVTAPLPPACDKFQAGPCATATGSTPVAPVKSNGAGGGATQPAGPGAAAGGGATAAAGPSAAGVGPAGPTAQASVDPDTGVLVSGDAGGQVSAGSDVTGVAAQLAPAASTAAMSNVLWALTSAFLLALLVVPVAFARFFSGRSGGTP